MLKHERWRYIALYLFFCVIDISVITLEKNHRIDAYIQDIAQKSNSEYLAVYESYKNLADFIYESKIDKPEILSIFSLSASSNDSIKNFARDELYLYLREDYEIMEKFGLKQLQFSLPEDKSFLLFYKTEPFEGYRFTYPLVFNGKPLGSVELSFDIGTIIAELNRTNAHIEFISDKKSEFEMYKKAQEKRVFAKEIRREKKQEIAVFIPVQNSDSKKIEGYVIIYQADDYIENKEKNYYALLILTITIITMIFYILRKDAIYKRKLEENNAELSDKVARQLAELREKDRVIFEQAKYAAMGEMMDAIAHQWKQPLGVIKLQALQLEYAQMDGTIDENILRDSTKGTMFQIDHLLKTMEMFRNFFRSGHKTESVKLSHILESIKTLLKDELIQNRIDIEFETTDECHIDVIESEFIHILINLINNSKDAFKEKNIEQRTIKITQKESEEFTIIKVCDNAGGIPESAINRIFEANFTTKEKGKGSGIGLYMSKTIIEKIDGTIGVYNTKNGCCFEIGIHKKKCRLNVD